MISNISGNTFIFSVSSLFIFSNWYGNCSINMVLTVTCDISCGIQVIWCVYINKLKSPNTINFQDCQDLQAYCMTQIFVLVSRNISRIYDCNGAVITGVSLLGSCITSHTKGCIYRLEIQYQEKYLRNGSILWISSVFDLHNIKIILWMIRKHNVHTEIILESVSSMMTTTRDIKE